MPTLWLTYAWTDNATHDVDYVAQRLEDQGVSVRLDRRRLVVGRRLWEQIASEVEESDLDGWAIFATRASFESEACREELYCALDRALQARGKLFPLIAIVGDAPFSELPTALRVRLAVSLRDADWPERVAGALRGEAIAPRESRVPAYEVILHDQRAKGRWCIEIRPRDGMWSPVVAAVAAESAAHMGSVLCGPRGQPTGTGWAHTCDVENADGTRKGKQINDHADPSRSLYVFFTELPRDIDVGMPGTTHRISIPPQP